MKQNFIIRMVTQDGKLSFRKCMIDSDGDVTHISSEPFAFKAEDREHLNIQMNMVQEAMSLPVLTIPSGKGGGWVDQNPFLDELEDS